MRKYTVPSCSPTNFSASTHCGSYICSDSGFSAVEEQKNICTSWWQESDIPTWYFGQQPLPDWLVNLDLELCGYLCPVLCKCAWLCGSGWGLWNNCYTQEKSLNFSYTWADLLGDLVGLSWSANSENGVRCKYGPLISVTVNKFLNSEVKVSFPSFTAGCMVGWNYFNIEGTDQTTDFTKPSCCTLSW